MTGNTPSEQAFVNLFREKEQVRDDIVKLRSAFPCLTEAAAFMLRRGLQAEGIKDVDEWLNQQPLPRTGSRVATVQRLIAEGRGPKVIRWKPFYDLVRDEGKGWITVRGKRKPAPGFNNRTIRRDVMGVKDI